MEKLTCCTPIAWAFISNFSIIVTIPCFAITENFMDNNLDCRPAISNFGRDFSSALVHIFFLSDQWAARAHIVVFFSFHVPPHPVPFSIFFSYLFLLSAYWSHVGVAWLPNVLLCWTGPRGLFEKELCAASADRLTQPLPASDPLLTGSPVCQGRKKRKQRGSVHPRAEHRTLFILSPMLLPESPIPASGWLYLKFTNIPLSEVLRSFGCSIPSFQWCLKEELCQCCPQAGEVKHAGFKYLYNVCLAQPHLWHLSCYIRREIEEQGSRIKAQLPVEL